MLNRTMKRQFKRRSMNDEDRKKYFPNHKTSEMNYFDPDERIKIVNNRLYWIAY